MLYKDKEKLKSILHAIPNEPGVYKYFNADNELIYIGKAKYLRKRIVNYFLDLKKKDRKTQRLVTQINRIEFTLVTSEYEALLLENNLIKAFKPKYNILLKDDKSFPFICITDENFPRLLSTRRPETLKGKFFGPYTSVGAMNDLADSIRKIFQLRTCDLNLSAHNIMSGKYKVCLEYHIDNCKGPCVGQEQSEDYQQKIKQAIHILNGNYGVVKTFMQSEMLHAAGKLKFEEANAYKITLEKINQLEKKSVIVNPDLGNLLALAIASNENKAIVSSLLVYQGSIIHTLNTEIKKRMHETDAEILFHAYLNLQSQIQLREKINGVVCNLLPKITEVEDLQFTVPQIGDKKKLVDIAYKNAFQALHKYKEEKQDHSLKGLQILQQELSLKDLPRHIECFDNSNIQGTNPVASMVCFMNGKPSKKNYRHFNVKTVIGPDDFASMKEIVGRRYTRVLEEGTPLPNLIVIDGGKGQLSAAVEVLKELNVYGKVPVIGLAKRLEEIYFPGDSESLILGRRSEGLKILQQIRNEAHRFAITFHRNQRSKNTFNKSVLNQIQGIGPDTIKKLLHHFKTVKAVQAASVEELKPVIGKAKAELLILHFKKLGE
jgi:excinuclease ABC subunit C